MRRLAGPKAHILWAPQLIYIPGFLGDFLIGIAAQVEQQRCAQLFLRPESSLILNDEMRFPLAIIYGLGPLANHIDTEQHLNYPT